MEDPEKKQSSLWGCAFILLIIAIFAGSALYKYFSYLDHNHNNALVPHNDSTQVVEETENNQEDTEMDSEEKAIHDRVQKIYNDALSMDENANYVGRYCSEELKSLILKADESDPDWLDSNIWVFDSEWSSPRLEQIRVDDYSNYEAVVKITIRPFSDAEKMNIITLSMVKEEGNWLIDDFKRNGRSIKSQAFRAAEDFNRFNHYEEYSTDGDYYNED